MGIETRPATAADMAAMVWDLVEGFALLTASLADELPSEEARKLEALLRRMGDRAEEIDKLDLAAKLERARSRYASMLH